MLILIVNGTPVLSLVIFEVTRLEGVLVGKGPAVSVGARVHEPVEPVPEPEPEEDVVSVTVSFLQELSKGATNAKPKDAIPFFKKALRSIFFYLRRWCQKINGWQMRKSLR
jgi:hypothetical protein